MLQHTHSNRYGRYSHGQTAFQIDSQQLHPEYIPYPMCSHTNSKLLATGLCYSHHTSQLHSLHMLTRTHTATDSTGQLALNALLERCEEVLHKFVADERLSGSCPLPR